MEQMFIGTQFAENEIMTISRPSSPTSSSNRAANTSPTPTVASNSTTDDAHQPQQQSRPVDPALASLASRRSEARSPTNVPSSSRPRGLARLGEARNITDMPAEILDNIASNLQGRDVVAMASSHRAIGPAIQPQVNGARTLHEISQVNMNTIAGFQAVVAAISDLRADLQVGPLLQLGFQIRALPHDVRPQATVAYQSAVSSLPDSRRTPELVQMARVLALANPIHAVRAGANVQFAAQACGITTPAFINRLERIAIEHTAPTSAGNVVRAGGNVQDVARERGITTPAGIQSLEQIAIQDSAPTSAGNVVRAGGNVQDVARERGITTPAGIDSLEQIAALRS
jgi:hypothetical protein